MNKDNVLKYDRLKDSDKVRIVYPTEWKFKLILKNDADADSVVKRILDLQEYGLEFSRNSSKGSYSSYTLTMTLLDENHRKAMYDSLGSAPEILKVL